MKGLVAGCPSAQAHKEDTEHHAAKEKKGLWNAPDRMGCRICECFCSSVVDRGYESFPDFLLVAGSHSLTLQVDGV